jgi:hypothetical protein
VPAVESRAPGALDSTGTGAGSTGSTSGTSTVDPTVDSTGGALGVLGSTGGGGTAVDTVAVDFGGKAAVVLRSCRF